MGRIGSSRIAREKAKPVRPVVAFGASRRSLARPGFRLLVTGGQRSWMTVRHIAGALNSCPARSGRR